MKQGRNVRKALHLPSVCSYRSTQDPNGTWSRLSWQCQGFHLLLAPGAAACREGAGKAQVTTLGLSSGPSTAPGLWKQLDIADIAEIKK